MFAIAFDLVVADTEKYHPKGVSQAYTDISSTLGQFGFRRIQGSVYVTDGEDMVYLFQAIIALKSLAWFPHRCATFAHSASSNGPTSLR
jgi:virulence-associated protein VapD